MSIVIWVMISIALWHFAVWFPDKFWGGIVGAFVAACIGGIISGFILSGFTFPNNNPAGAEQLIDAVPGCLLALILCYFYGSRLEKANA